MNCMLITLKQKLGIFRYKVLENINEVIWKNLEKIPNYDTLLPKLFSGTRKLNIVSTYDFCTERGTIKKVFDESEVRKFWKKGYSIEEYGKCKELVDVDAFKIYVGVLNDAKVIGGTEFIACEDKYLSDRLKWNENGIGAFKSPCEKIINEKGVILKPQKMHKEEISKGIFLLGRWSGNYYHLTMDLISRLGYIDEFSEYDEYPLLIDEASFKDVKNKELIERINTKKHPIITIKANHMYHVKELVYPSLHVWTFLNNRDRGDSCAGAIDGRCIDYLREKLLPLCEDNEIYRKVYVTRGNNKRLVNEDEVAAFFENNGFLVVNPDDMTLMEEIECFAAADVLIGCIGAAFTNTVYCKRNSLVILISAEQNLPEAASSMAENIGIDFWYAIAKIYDAGDGRINHTQIYLPIEECEKVLQIIEKKKCK